MRVAGSESKAQTRELPRVEISGSRLRIDDSEMLIKEVFYEFPAPGVGKQLSSSNAAVNDEEQYRKTVLAVAGVEFV